MTGKRLAKEGIYRVKRLDRGRGWRVEGGWWDWSLTWTDSFPLRTT